MEVTQESWDLNAGVQDLDEGATQILRFELH